MAASESASASSVAAAIVTRESASASLKISSIREDGLSNVSLVLDFDRTITAYHGPRGGLGQTCHGIIGGNRSAADAADAAVLSARYHPIEIDPKLTFAEKTPLMQEWYELANSLIIRQGLRRADIVAAVAAANVQLRRGVKELIDFCLVHHVPIIIFSAGIGDVLKEVLRQLYGPLPADRVRIVSNFMVFSDAESEDRGSPLAGVAAEGAGVAAEGAAAARADAGAPATAFSSPVIHPFNKSEAAAIATDAKLRAFWRKNVILVGDSLGDATMAREADFTPAGSAPAPCAEAAVGGAAAQPAASALGHGAVLRVGIINDGATREADLPLYLARFDTVLVDDPPLDYVLDILQQLAAL